MKINAQNQLQKTLDLIEKNNKQFIDFKENQFPEFIEETKKSIAIEVLEKVNKMEGELVTIDMLKDAFEQERTTNIQNRIDLASQNINETINKEMLKQTENLGDTIKMISQVEQIVQYHEQKLIEEEKEGKKFDDKQIEELGI